MKDTEKQIRRPGRRLRIFFVAVVLFLAALVLWHRYSYRGMAELPLRTGEARAASQELCARHEALRSVELRYRFPGFLKVECRAGSLTPRRLPYAGRCPADSPRGRRAFEGRGLHGLLRLRLSAALQQYGACHG